MSSRAAIWRDETPHCQESLGLSCGLAPRHPSLSLTRRLMRVFREALLPECFCGGVRQLGQFPPIREVKRFGVDTVS